MNWIEIEWCTDCHHRVMITVGGVEYCKCIMMGEEE